MKKKKSKKKGRFLNYKLFVIVGGLFHFIVYLFYDSTFYNNAIFWSSLLFCGLALGAYFIMKMNLMSPKNYKKIEGIKLKAYMFFVCFFLMIGTTIIFGNVINGIILGLNYIGRNDEIIKCEYKIQKITHNRTGSRKQIRRNNPEVYLEKGGELISLNLSERYNTTKKYSEYKTIELNLSKGLFGFEIVDSYKLKK